MTTTTTTTTTVPIPKSTSGGYLQTPTPVPTRPFILLPLYIYPGPAAWEPLYAAAGAHVELDFYVVVNPGNGPGVGPLPDANYVDALVRLTALPNVKVVGYVYCSYGKRLVEDIVADVEAYARWEREMEKLGDEEKTIVVDGIFIDETPSSTQFVEYMATLSNAAKTILNRNVIMPTPSLAVDDTATAAEDDEDDEAAGVASATAEPGLEPPTAAAPAGTGTGTGAGADAGDGTPPPPPAVHFLAPRQPLAAPPTPSASTAVVIYNPGVVVDPIFYQAADYVVAFENAAGRWGDAAVRQGFSRLPRPLAQRSVAVAHGAAGGPVGVAQLSRRAAEAGCAGQFVTSRGGYTEWCPAWGDFVDEMARRALLV